MHRLRMRSLPKIKIKFGERNFVDSDTLLKFCIYYVFRVVDLLLLG